MALLVFLPSTPCFGHEKVITAKELPTAAQMFINTHFKGKRITEAKKDVEMRKTCYDVTLDNGANWNSTVRAHGRKLNASRLPFLLQQSLLLSVNMSRQTIQRVGL